MANGAINFKNNSGNIVSFISGSGSDIIISGGTLNLSNMTGLTLGNLTMVGTVETASFAPSYLLTSSFNTYSGTTNTVIGTLQTSTASLNNRITSIEGVTGSYATTGSNIFKSSQTITGSLFVSENLVIAGSSSIQYISSSIVNIDDNIITVNAMNPSVRFGGLSVIDSGSSPQVSGSMLFDSINNQWIFVHQNQSSVTSSVLLMGPETYDNLGNEAYITANRLVKSTGIEHLSDSNITDTGTKVSINSTTEVTGSFIVTGNVGINTASPSEKLEVQDGYISTYHNLNSNDAGYGIQFYTNGGGSKNSLASIVLSQVGTNRSGNLLFQTSNAGTPTTKMTITSSGNVGIGTSSPSTTFNVGHESHGIGMAYMGGSALPAIAGLFTDTSSGQQGYGSLLIKSRSDYAGYSINFYTAASNNTPVERMRINSTGNVGIGTTSPNGRLTIKAELSDTAPSLVFRNELGGPSSAISNFVSVSQTFTVIGTNVYVNSTGNFTRFDTGKQSCAIVLDEGLINFTTGPTGATASSRMAITSGGAVYIGTTSNPLSNATPLLGIVAGAATDVINIRHNQDGNNTINVWQTGNTTHTALAFYKGNTQDLRGGISVSTSGVVYNTTSDYRLKTNITPIENGIDRLMQLKPSKFNWIESGEETEGFIAHELQEIFPYAVIGEKDAIYSSTGKIKPQSVDYGRITPLLVKAIQELKAELEIAKAEIQTLKQ